VKSAERIAPRHLAHTLAHYFAELAAKMDDDDDDGQFDFSVH
jgi:hypothetical protein